MEFNTLIFKSFLYALPGQSAFYLNALNLRAQPAADGGNGYAAHRNLGPAHPQQ